MKKETPYNFFPQTDYSSQGRAMVQFVAEKWKEMHGGNPPRPPKLGLAYPNVPYGTTPIPAIKDMAKRLGVELCPDQIVELTATDATAQMLKFKECGADFVWAGGTAASSLVIMRDAKKVGLNAPVFVNVWGGNEQYFRANPDATDGNYYLTSVLVYYPDIENSNTPGAKIIREFAKAKGRAPYTDLNAAYVRGWANVNVLYKALREVISPPPPVKQQIVSALYKIGAQINKLDYSLAKLQSYDKMLFEKTVNALVEGDKSKAAMYANEVAEVRKMARVIMTVRYALERVKLRLETAVIFGDVQANLAPAIVALRQVAGYIKGMIPDVFAELVEIDENLQVAMLQATTQAPIPLESTYVTEEAQRILRDASIVAEQRLKEAFPELPTFEKAQAPSKTPSEESTK
jgi:division protein CdvB (Snf7/Vps24/ESCRT-III family)